MEDYERVEPDDLVSRPSGRWAEQKLYYFRRYLYAFNMVTKGKWTRSIVDLLAGSGRCHLKDDPSYCFEGSPLIAAAAQPPIERLLFVEEDPQLAAALRERLQRKGLDPKNSVLEGDCNSPDVIARARDVLAGTLGLVFADTLGLSSIRLDTLRKIITGRRTDLIYTFHVQDVTRNIGRAAESETEAARFAASLGADWKAAWLQYRDSRPYAEDADAIEEFFEQQLHSLGYEFVEPLRSVMKNSRGAPLYRLWLASNYEKAPDLWRGISDIDHAGRRRLF